MDIYIYNPAVKDISNLEEYETNSKEELETLRKKVVNQTRSYLLYTSSNTSPKSIISTNNTEKKIKDTTNISLIELPKPTVTESPYIPPITSLNVLDTVNIPLEYSPIYQASQIKTQKSINNDNNVDENILPPVVNTPSSLVAAKTLSSRNEQINSSDRYNNNNISIPLSSSSFLNNDFDEKTTTYKKNLNISIIKQRSFSIAPVLPINKGNSNKPTLGPIRSVRTIK